MQSNRFIFEIDISLILVTIYSGFSDANKL